MTKKSAGILLYRFKDNIFQVLLAHPGGPFWVKKDLGAWSIPKGEFTDDENPLEAAKREFKEEIGVSFEGDYITLTPIKQKSGKLIYAYAIIGDFNPTDLKSNTFEMEWPPKSGKLESFPEIDKCMWFTSEKGKQKINLYQAPLIDELIKKLNLTEDVLFDTRDNTDSQNPQLDLF